MTATLEGRELVVLRGAGGIGPAHRHAEQRKDLLRQAQAGDRAAMDRVLALLRPYLTQVAALVSGRRSPRDAVADLLSREQGPERG